MNWSQQLKQQKPGKIRIIGGKWRSRKLPVPDIAGLRPTPGRARETLFNWLQNFIEGARCLDLFAGTGALGLEAASRGAASVILVEQDRHLADRIAENIKTLDATEASLVRSDAITWLRKCTDKFDLVFLDPPFEQGLVEKSCDLLRQRECLVKNAYIYIEAERSLEIPSFLEIVKEGKAGHVKYLLAKMVYGDS